MPDLSQLHTIKYRTGKDVKTYKAIDAIAKDWKAIGKELGMKDRFLRAQSSHDDKTAAMTVVRSWTRSDEKATWLRLIAAMRVGGKLRTEAKELEKALLSRV